MALTWRWVPRAAVPALGAQRWVGRALPGGSSLREVGAVCERAEVSCGGCCIYQLPSSPGLPLSLAHFPLVNVGRATKPFFLMIGLPNVVKCGIQVFLVPVGLGDGNSFACGIRKKGGPLHSSTDGDMKRELRIVA